MNTIARNVGSAFGGQVAGVIIAAHVIASGLPADRASRSRSCSARCGALVAAASVLLIPGRVREPVASAA